MDVTVERIFALIKERGTKAAYVAKDTGLPKSGFTDWKMGRSKPSTEAIAKLAVYFGVTSDYLLGLANAPDESITPDIFQGLPPEAQRDILQYVEFVRQKYNDG